MDEILIGAILTPSAFSNLRCGIRNTINCSDASGHGGAAAEASRFAPALSANASVAADVWKATLIEESVNVSEQEFVSRMYVSIKYFIHFVRNSDSPSFGRCAFCPRKCGKLFCSIKCIHKHCTNACYFEDPNLLRFGEGFSGPRASLTWAHCCEGISVLTPFDELYDPEAYLLL